MSADWKEERSERERDLRVPIVLVATIPFVFALATIVSAIIDSPNVIVEALFVMILQGAAAIALGIRVVVRRRRTERERIPAARIVR